MTLRRPEDDGFMAKALELAAQARPSPNPRVGAVIVKDGEIVGTGFHKRTGGPHAEVLAIEDAKDLAQGATIYVTLEPCCHHGRTGPCTEAVHAAGIGRVVLGILDPDTRVSGQGAKRLESLGHQVTTGVMKDECEELLEDISIIGQRDYPLVTLKAAVTMDGYLASTTGDSKWISSLDSRTIAHRMRADSDGIIVGVNTAIADNPTLNVRHCEGENPTRIVMDSSLRIPDSAGLLNSPDVGPVLIAYCSDTMDDRALELSTRPNVKALRCEADSCGKVAPGSLLKNLAEEGITSVLVEGGARIHGAFAREGLAHKAALFVSPKLLGGGEPWIRFFGVEEISKAVELRDLKATPVGSDIIIQARFAPVVSD